MSIKTRKKPSPLFKKDKGRRGFGSKTRECASEHMDVDIKYIIIIVSIVPLFVYNDRVARL